MSWRTVAKTTDIPDDAGYFVEVAGLSIALFRVDGEVYAIEDTCPHAFAQLSQGFFDGEVVECPLHQACFNVRTGKVLSGPALENVKTYPVRVESDVVQLEL